VAFVFAMDFKVDTETLFH